MIEFPLLLLIGFAALIFLLKNWKIVVWLIATVVVTTMIFRAVTRMIDPSVYETSTQEAGICDSPGWHCEYEEFDGVKFLRIKPNKP